VRIAPAEPGELAGEHHRAVTLRRADAYLPGKAITHARQRMLDGHAGAFHRFHSRQQVAPGFGELVATRLAQEQLQAHAFFQRLQTTGHGGVVHGEPARRGRQPPRSGDLEEIAQIVPVHG